MTARRGQPPKLAADTEDGRARRQHIVAAVAAGRTLAQAAAAAGVTKATVINTQNRDGVFAQELRRARVRHANPDAPRCTSCGQPELTLTPDGAACACCGTEYRLIPVPAPLPLSLYDITAPPAAPLAQAS